MVDHRHEWGQYGFDDGKWACAECLETCPSCIVTRKGETHPTGCALLICDQCVSSERHVLDMIVEARDAIVIEPRSLVPAYAADIANAHTTDPEQLPYGMDHYTDDPDNGITGIRTESGVDDELWGWAGLWVDASGHAANADHVDYLKQMIMWAAHNERLSHFAVYRREVRQLLGRTRHLGAPQVEEVGPKCFDCGGPLVREWLGDGTTRDPKRRGLGERVKCELCLREYDTVRYRLAFRAKVEAEGSPDSLVTEVEARTIFPSLATGSLRVWIGRGKIESRGQRRGVSLYRLGDVRVLVRGDNDSGRIGA